MRNKILKLKIFKHLCFLDSVFAMMVSILFWMEICIGEPRHTTTASLMCAIVFMAMAGIFWLGFLECRSKLNKCRDY